MKILYIHQYFKFPDQKGGTRSYDLSSSFIKKGVDVTVITSNPNPTDNKRWSYEEREGIKLHILNCKYNNSMSFYRRIWGFVYFMVFTTLRALKIKCDYTLATSTPLTIAIPAMIKKLFNRTPYVFEVRDVWPEVPIKLGYIRNKLAIKLLYWFEWVIYRNAYCVIPLSIGMERSISSRFKISNMIVIPNISEINRFQIEGESIKSDNKIILYAGTLGEANGLKYMVDLAYETSLIDSSIEYHVYGDGKQLPDLIQYADKLGILDKYIFFKGNVSKSELPNLYRKCTMGSSFVINNPIMWDNSANKYFDTLAAGKPILINHQGWQADEISEKNIGYVLPPEVNSDVAKEFISYINNPEILLEQGKNALRVAKTSYSLDVAATKYLKILGIK